MSSPGIKVIKKVSIEDTVSDAKEDEQVIQISVSNDPMQIFSAVPIVGLNESEITKDAENSNSVDNSLDMPVVHLEIGVPETPNSTALTQTISTLRYKSLNENSEEQGYVFRIPPLLRVRQFAVQERLPISIEEIKRRIGPPECLSQALILSLLRLNKERANHLRKALGQFGIDELSNRSAVVSSFSRLSEVESQGLAEDYYYLASRFMKVRTINKSVSLQSGRESNFVQKARNSKLVLEQILSEIEKRGRDLDLLTHGFSPLILRAVFNIIIEILTFREQENEFIFDSPQKIIS